MFIAVAHPDSSISLFSKKPKRILTKTYSTCELYLWDRIDCRFQQFCFNVVYDSTFYAATYTLQRSTFPSLL